ncbi:hypothetical protein [Pseudodonghicola flavimaris]|uniref:Uncharacterized protein n=1 Tax=Pseudodonghicola flavimaris TaxID=3050036 RepID=A0ABT7EYV6_9RHOB|nr:hypothetical protein [Pseudodonghicola flavimaris]MDK3017523.1 hypothetical protein [Pseudodonghicola flavimaris]
MALTSHSMAVARGNAGVAGQIVLCTGTGPVTVYVDENGAPTGPPHICPDFALHFLAFVAVPDIAPVPLALTFLRAEPPRNSAGHGLSRPVATARDPPAILV